MCRNIKILFNFSPPVTEDEIRAASLQFVRKVSGFNKPSKANEEAFLAAVEGITAISSRLLASLETSAPPVSGSGGRQSPRTLCPALRQVATMLPLLPPNPEAAWWMLRRRSLGTV